ncbi:Ubiquitin carboxyl-terminal hydrolase 45 [Galdieria sulphuraria]|nr:Ubiquitin carboxyl-terminal hydrolase 45 [Galdieria sulphuraria]
MSKKSKGKQKKYRQPNKKRNKNTKPSNLKQTTCSNHNSSCLCSENERKTRLAEIIAEEWKGNIITPKGLKNLGNTCFLNAVLQNIGRLPALRSYFLGQSITSGEHGVTLSLRVFFHTMWLLQDQSIFRPHKLLDHLGKYSSRFRGYEQQDAHEALRVLMESLMEEATVNMDNSSSDSSSHSDSNHNHESWMEKVFLGKLQSCVECEQCHSISTVEEPFLDISLCLETQNTDETCSVAGGCTRNQIICDTAMMSQQSLLSVDNAMLSMESNLSEQVMVNEEEEKNSPEMISLWEEDIHQVTLGLDSLFEESNNVEWSDYVSNNDLDFNEEQKVVHSSSKSLTKPISSSSTTTTLYASIQDSLQAFLSPEILQGENAYYCESCNRQQQSESTQKHCNKDSVSSQQRYIRTKAKKHFLFRKLGQVIIFHLKRFRQVGFHFEKVSGKMSFPLEWNLSSYTQEQQGDSTENDYYLSGIVVHQGSLEWGHYIAYIRASCSPQEHRWYYCSDEHVTLVQDEEQIFNSEAYILFYCKKQRQ